MARTEILVVGKHPEIMKVILRLLGNKPEWNGQGVFSAAEALAKSDTSFDLVLLGAGLTEQDVAAIKIHFKIPVIQHYGGGSGLLYAEIYQVINANNEVG